ncbi:Not a Proline racemase, nor 4-hydroxyproline epimerase [Fulvivirga imtechensis AK7]|uniref:Not a Proline racemase, nor 4-hydroxyproline epimerase n=1 Tax=Fulvivirga imtechensis AK7 TaxID=1237149 RepID=L8JL80_9BACT|nr:proline racemase family protein [Fulvivirga imtechensis]ELR68993.1 Not a Proline racemase, nor 4-hydroxyproline epimerase [Fulvivirga imtechensis AK7]
MGRISDIYQRILQSEQWKISPEWLRLSTIDMHTGGEPLRVVTAGFPEVPGSSLLECRRYVKEHYDYLRKLLMFEPRGHADMYGCILLPPFHSEADFSVLFMHNEGYSTMCGHAVIALAKLAVEMEWVAHIEPVTTIRIEAPCGLITAYAEVANGQVTASGFQGVPSFVLAEGVEVQVSGVGKVRADIAYGGAFYAYVDAEQLNIQLTPDNYSELIRIGREIKNTIIKEGIPVRHPEEKDLSFLYGTIFMGGPLSQGVDSRNVCVFADGEVDRSPTGSGVCGRMALHYHQKKLDIGQKMKIESIVGSQFEGKLMKEVTYGPHQAVIPEVWGTAYVTGSNEFCLDPQDPFREGFMLR